MDKEKNKVKKIFSPHVVPVHVGVSPSLLSAQTQFVGSSSGARNKRLAEEGKAVHQPLDLSGFKHLFMLLLFMVNLKMIWADWSNFGLSVTLDHFGFGACDILWSLTIYAICFLFMPIALLIERDASRKPRSVSFIFLHMLNCAACLYIGSKLNWDNIKHPMVSTYCEANVIVTCLKLYSFALTNYELHTDKELPEFYDNGPRYPHNLKWSNIIYYFCVPTLVYQPVYPKAPKTRWMRVLSLLCELMMELLLLWVLMMQIGMPTLHHLGRHRESFSVFIEDYLSFSCMNMVIWLVGFVVLFETSLNIVAEVTRFADRTFYSDWWNSSSVATFWRDWNLPVSNFFRRHVYTPLRARGVSKVMSANLVFLVSALLHELLFGVATHNFNGVAFICMIVQPLFMLATEPFERKRGPGSTLGNCVMWFSIFLGQPTAVVIYYLQWVELYSGQETKGWLYWLPEFMIKSRRA